MCGLGISQTATPNAALNIIESGAAKVVGHYVLSGYFIVFIVYLCTFGYFFAACRPAKVTRCAGAALPLAW